MKQALPWIVTSIVLGSIGQVLLKVAARQLGTLTLGNGPLVGTLLRLVANPYVWFGVLLFVTSMIMWIKALTTTSLASAYPMVAGGYVLVLIISALFLGEKIDGGLALGCAIICVGVIVLARAA